MSITNNCICAFVESTDAIVTSFRSQQRAQTIDFVQTDFHSHSRIIFALPQLSHSMGNIIYIKLYKEKGERERERKRKNRTSEYTFFNLELANINYNLLLFSPSINPLFLFYFFLVLLLSLPFFFGLFYTSSYPSLTIAPHISSIIC